MAVLTITNDYDPFLHVSLKHGESISCESDSMVMMEANLDLTGRINGGIFQAFMRRLTNGESFFQQHIKATRGDGDCLLAPPLPGSIQILDIGAKQYKISDGAYMASTEGVNVTAQMQNISTALFAGTGGFFIGQTSGHGQIALTGLGTLFTLDVLPHQPITVDNGHVVAWDSNLHYEISLSTSQNSGMLGNLINSVTSSEGIVLKFSGSGKVLICSRNTDSFIAWINSKIQTGS